MIIGFQNEADVLLWAVAKLISTFHHKQYLFAAMCVLLLSSVLGLQPTLVYCIDNHRFNCEKKLEDLTQQKSVVTSNWIPNISHKQNTNPENLRIDKVQDQEEAFIRKSKQDMDRHISDPLCRTRQGRINPFGSTKKNLKLASRLE